MIGFERMIQIAIKRLEQIGKEVTIHIRAISLAGRIQGRRGGHFELPVLLNMECILVLQKIVLLQVLQKGWLFP